MIVIAKHSKGKLGSEQNNEKFSLQAKEKDMSYLQEGSGNENLYDEFHLDSFLAPLLQDDDGNMQIMNAYGDPQILCNSYTFRVNEDYDTTYSACQKTILSDEEINRNILGEALESWFKITIPNGRKYKMWLINLLQSYCSVGFTPVDFQYIRNSIQFFVQSAKTAVELMNINYQISDEENKKISIFVNTSSEPASVFYKLTPEQMHSLKLSMKKRYDVSRKALYLGKLRFDQDLLDSGMDIFLNRKSCMTATLQIIQEDFPELLSLNVSNNKIYWLDGMSELIEKAPHIKTLNLSRNLLRTAWELEKMKGLKLEQLWLEGNPLCSTFRDYSSYVSAILNYFPELSYLDGMKLFPTIDINTLEIIKPRKESYKGSESLKNLLVQFMLQYYLIYDYGDRHSLLSAYHADACFSLTITFNSEKEDLSNLEDYVKDNRNMMRLKNSLLRLQLLKHKKCNILTCLHELPKTQHDLNSYVIDLCVQTEFYKITIRNYEIINSSLQHHYMRVHLHVDLQEICPVGHFEDTWKCNRDDEALFTFQFGIRTQVSQYAPRAALSTGNLITPLP
ncbi:nuclear RNA export factor 5-like [Grammomys surdaster]|uniref:nuclear RNA export factor 5-like n=1 Tax=Grammomys surdaster TaxID=491861 RepID=UPI0010A0209A|nr:nuclear RNA export factor 5-like [Grammomys surdaster]